MRPPKLPEQLRLFKAEKLAELAHLRAARAEAVDQVVAVALAEGHAAIQNLFGRNLQRCTHNLMHSYHLWTRVEPVATCQECQRVDVSAEVRPLSGAQPAVLNLPAKTGVKTSARKY